MPMPQYRQQNHAKPCKTSKMQSILSIQRNDGTIPTKGPGMTRSWKASENVQIGRLETSRYPRFIPQRNVEILRNHTTFEKSFINYRKLLKLVELPLKNPETPWDTTVSWQSYQAQGQSRPNFPQRTWPWCSHVSTLQLHWCPQFIYNLIRIYNLVFV